MRGMIDVHSHILPAVDDGSRSIGESLELIKHLRELGFVGIIATPHYYPESRPDKADRIRAAAEQLRQAVKERWPEFQISLGQELYYHTELIARMSQGRGLTIEDTRNVMVEFDPGVSFRTIREGIRNLTHAGYRPILAHMERYPALQEDRNLDEIAGMNCMLQMNYESLQGSLLDRRVRWCRRQVLEGMVDLLGTDLHRTDFRPPEIGPALKWLEKHVQPDDRKRMTRTNVLKILKD